MLSCRGLEYWNVIVAMSTESRSCRSTWRGGGGTGRGERAADGELEYMQLQQESQIAQHFLCGAVRYGGCT